MAETDNLEKHAIAGRVDPLVRLAEPSEERGAAEDTPETIADELLKRIYNSFRYEPRAGTPGEEFDSWLRRNVIELVSPLYKKAA